MQHKGIYSFYFLKFIKCNAYSFLRPLCSLILYFQDAFYFFLFVNFVNVERKAGMAKFIKRNGWRQIFE